MRIIDFEKIIFRINIISIIIIFALLAPSTTIIASWYPERRDVLWLFPVFILIFSAVAWFFMCWKMPYFIEQGIFQDRRKTNRAQTTSKFERFWKISFPIFVLCFQIAVLILLSMCMVAFMRSETLMEMLTNLP